YTWTSTKPWAVVFDGSVLPPMTKFAWADSGISAAQRPKIRSPNHLVALLIPIMFTSLLRCCLQKAILLSLAAAWQEKSARPRIIVFNREFLTKPHSFCGESERIRCPRRVN